ncbi:MAG: 3-hydroxybutyryl-CoA dehydrogenase [Rhodospirillales bacterium]|jgi:3-hydroxybutyryl-CoA dehydrogenase|nr:3-hydroxybutyryl-CoA dehydrogenase [Rhodospirillales bacterium]
MAIEKIGVVGAGTMGNGIAQIFAVAGYDVIMRDIKEEFVERGLKTVAKNLDRLIARGKLTAEAKDQALARIRTATTLDGFGDRDLIIEAIVENVEIKAKLFRDLDAVCSGDAILATNTSSISITKVAAASKRPERVVGMHFFNPVPVMQLVEIIRALQTADEVVEQIEAVSRAVGKTPHTVKDSYGFVVNRVLIPMINEAINCLYEGLTSPEDIDAVMKLGANHPMGPLSLADLIGLDIILDIMETLYRGFDDPKYRPSPLLKQMVDAGYLGRKTGRGFFRYN